MGCERGRLTRQVATRLRWRRDRHVADTRRNDAGKLARPHCVCEQRWCAWGVATARQSNFSQLNLSVVPGESISSPTRLQIVCKVVVNASQQYARLPSLATAKMYGRS